MKVIEQIFLTIFAGICLTTIAAEPASPIEFSTEIIPVLTRAGCNAGACHGAAAGRGGFHLSLWGSDPASDYDTIVHAFEGRRINLAHPDESLLIAKPTGHLNHGGKNVLDANGAARILEWIRAGAPRGVERKLTSLEITPRRHLAAELPESVPLKAVARFDDGPSEDVTEWTVFTPSDPSAVVVQASSLQLKRRGQHVVIARFLNRVVPIQLSVPLNEKPVDFSLEPRANFIDDETQRVLAELRLPLSPPASDAAFLRRVTLDLTGRLPEPAAIDAYLKDNSPDKRARLVDALLVSPAFNDFWTLRFARLLRIHSLPNENEGVRAYAGWLHREFEHNTGLDKMARQLLTATGDTHEIGPANFGRMVQDARAHAELAGQFFLGVRLGCANCHNHPLDKWTQDDYHGFAAIFARLERGREVRLSARGAVTNLRTNEPALPRIPGERYLSADADHRADVAEWLTADKNRYFAKATVNRLWRFMFGRGLVEPADDMRETNPPTHPELLDRLADDFIQHRYDLRHTLKLIALSHAYALSDSTLDANASDDRFYSHAYHRALDPEILADAIADVTGVPEEYAGQPRGTRAVALIDPLTPSPSLDVLGRCSRLGGCDEKAAAGAGLPAQLHLLNGPIINQKLTSDKGRLHQLISAGRTNEEIVDEFYSRALGRHPSAEEQKRWADRLKSADENERKKRLEDFAWSILNSRQFMENH